MRTSQAAEAEQFLRSVFQPGDVIEIRALSDEGSVSALFDDMAIASRAAVTLNTKHGLNVYFTLNPLNRDTETVRNHAPLNIPKVRGYSSASDRDIERRNLYLIDIDPVRPSGVASSPIELSNAKGVALNVREYLTAMGWPEPIQVSSGNGVHLLYRGQGPAADYFDWRNALRFLDYKFSTADAKIDTSVYNPGRVSRLPGCFNRKGENIPERPHRMARVISYPSRFEVVPTTKVIDLTFEDPRLYPSKTTYSERELVIDEDGLRDLIESYPEVLAISKVTTKGDETWFGFAECPFAERAHRGQWVGAGKSAVVINPTKNQLGFNCFSPDCADNSFGKLRKLLEERTGRPTPQIFADEIHLDDLLGRWGVEWVEGSEPVEPEEWEHAGEILRTFREIADPDHAWGMPTQESIHSEIKMARERHEADIRQAARRTPKPKHIAAEQRRYLTVEELTLRLGLKDGGPARP